jgi:hypothetical protein
MRPSEIVRRGLISNAGGNTARVYNFDMASLTVPA